MSAGRNRAFAALGLAAFLVLALGGPLTGLARFEREHPVHEDEARAPHPEELVPSVEAAFRSESYARGDVASLEFYNRADGVRLTLRHSGPEGQHTVGRNEMQGRLVTRPVELGRTTRGRVVRVRIGDWPSGLYFARLDASDGRAGFAPLVVRPRTLGEHRVAVVLPTQTWQAYNVRRGKSWYANTEYHFARLYRPFLNRGVPPNFKRYDLRFLHWLDRHGKQVDFLADGDLDATPSGEALARAYDLVVFPGHHEYVTRHEYDVVEGFRNRGGNLVFLSANNFYWQVVRRGAVMERTKPWRDLGRPEAGLIGIQYRAHNRGFGRYLVVNTRSEPWVLAGTGLKVGSTFGNGGIEIDSIGSASPRHVRVIAVIPSVFGPGFNAYMTTYRARGGGEVFASGAFTLADASAYPLVSRIIENVWARMTSDN